VSILNSHNLTFERNLLHHNNRYGNTNLIQNGISTVQTGNHNTFIENEFYYFHRYALTSKSGTGTIARRNYCNSRGYVDVSGGFPSGDVNRGDACIQNYPHSHGIYENNISENSHGHFWTEPKGTTVDNQFLGNIAIDGVYGFLIRQREDNGISVDTYLKDNLALSVGSIGFYFRGNRNTIATQNSAIGASQGFAADYLAAYGANPPRSVFLTNNLAHSTTTWAFNMVTTSLEDWLVDYGAAVASTGGTFSPAATNANITNEVVSASNLMGDCRVWVPLTATALKAIGAGGMDIGATILYAYVNGWLTSTKLWDTASSGLWLGGLGTTIAGTNPTFSASNTVTQAEVDINTASNSAVDVHSRLNIMSAGCLPAGY
jgi:hypothetical protein